MKIRLQDTKTGEIKTLENDDRAYDWEDGNYSCDCNRSIFFYGLSLDDSYPCGDSRFKLLEISE